MTDTNKVVQLLALDVVARIATGMGRPFEKHTRFFALPVATVLADQKANIRQAGLTTLTAVAAACEGVDSLVHGFATALESANPVQRATLLNWISDWFKAHEPSPGLDLSTWAAPIVSCLDDRSGDVRKAAQAALPFVIASCGADYVLQQTNSLKPASRNTVVPLVRAAATAAPTQEKASKPKSVSAPIKTAASAPISPPPQSPQPTRSSSPSVAPPAAAPTSKLTGVRRRLPQGSISRPDSRAETIEEPSGTAATSRIAPKPTLGGLKKPISTFAAKPATTSAPTPTSVSNTPFTVKNIEAKKSRLNKDGIRWIIESGPVRKDLVDLLQVQMEPHTSRDLFSLLFSRDHNAINDYISGMSMICEFYSGLVTGDDKYGFSGQDRHDIGVANADLALKYVSVRVHEPQPNLIGKCLDVAESVMAFLRDVNYQLSDAEALCFVPTIINKVGPKKVPSAILFTLLISVIARGRPRSSSYSSTATYPSTSEGICVQQDLSAVDGLWVEIEGGQDAARLVG